MEHGDHLPWMVGGNTAGRNHLPGLPRQANVKHHSPNLWKGLAVTILCVGASAILAWALSPDLERQAPFLPFTLAIIASAWYGGLLPGLIATVLSSLVADYFFIEPIFRFGPVHSVHFSLFGLFLAVGISISLLHKARSKADAALRTTLTSLDEAIQRSELAASQAKIGFHEFVASTGKEIWTPEMERLFGLSPGSFEGSYDHWVKRMDPEDGYRIKAERAACIRERKTDWQYEYRAVMPDGHIRWIEGRSRLFFSQSGALERIVGANIDVTSHRKMEHALAERSEELARSNEELERFAYAVSHDLQEPLRGVTAMTELFLNRTRGMLDAESIRLLDVVLNSAERMKRLIREMLELARTTYDPLEEGNEVDTRAIVDQVLQDLGEPIHDSGAEIILDSLPATRANEGQLSRLFRNLIGNAIKYRGERAPRIHISASAATGEQVFCVSDNGIGIDPRYHRQIFEMFRRLHSASQYEGTGLGLAICERIVRRHQGRIWVESEPGKGARFYFSLPGHPHREAALANGRANSQSQAAGS